MFIASLIAAVALQTAPAQTGGSAPAPAPAKPAEAANPAKPVPEKKICKTSIPTGSNMEIRVCKTQAQWDAERTNAERSMDNLNGVSSNH